MKEFMYTVKDEQGIHARPAGMLAKEAKKYESKITIYKDEKSAEGPDEEAAADGIKAFLEANL